MLSDAESAAEYALSLDDQSVEAFAALGRVKMIKRDYAGAEVAFLKTIELNPNDARAYKILAEIYNRTGRNDEAFVMIQKALELNPMSGEVNASGPPMSGASANEPGVVASLVPGLAAPRVGTVKRSVGRTASGCAASSKAVYSDDIAIPPPV